ncbi:hypothetical protein [Acetobacter orientalis]|uniref:hypothetical protein n=1 Tax=Acetobacter orientalis TaxID=146474 RepID=UPI0039E75BA9
MKYYFVKLESGIIGPGVCLSGDLPAGAIECSQEQYENSGNYTLDNGVIVAYTPPAIPLNVQAGALLKTQQSYVMQNYAIYGDDTPPEWLTYLKALRAIANGTDTTSTTLPTAPATS